uniref:Putative irf-2-binding protein celtix-1 n=1 Tax=Corethrella appendiculata TaxID=1370023 RepID=U5EPR5_9DIPT
MGSKKHKKHKSERKEREEKYLDLNRPPSLKLILKVSGNSSTPEHSNNSPAYGVSEAGGGLVANAFTGEYSGAERHKKSKKKKKKKDREKKHKHHKEKRRHRDDSSQEDFSIGDESQPVPEMNTMFYTSLTTSNSVASSPVTRPLIPIKSPLADGDSIELSIQTACDKNRPPSSIDSPMISPASASIQSPLSHDMKMESQDSKSMLEIPRPSSTDSGREQRSCVIKLKQSRSPLAKLLDHLLKALEKRDPHQFFAWPVTDDIAPGYSTIITKPMDFSTIRQKIDDNEYTTLNEFSDDFKLMCENAIKYNHSETVYHKAAKKLLHVGAKLLQPESLLRSLRPLMIYMRELSFKELGFELPSENENQENDQIHTIDSADEAVAAAVDENINAQIEEEEEKRKQIRLENNPKSKYEAFVDDLTPDEVLQQVQNAAENARKRVLKRKHAHKMGFLRQNKDGTTSMKILLDAENEGPEKVISLGAFTGKLQQGTGQLQGFHEDRRNTAKIVKPLNYGAFSSFAPIFDSRFSNLTKDESEMILGTYGDETGADYAESMVCFTKDSQYASVLANGLLDLLTNGEHRKTMATLMENQRQKTEEKVIEKTFPDAETKENLEKYSNVKINFDNLRSLESLGVDVKFLNDFENSMTNGENVNAKISDSLNSNSELLEKLHQMQQDRLSAPLPLHLSHIQHACPSEIQLAHQITSNITEIAKQLPPIAISSPHGIRKAIGLSNVGLESFQMPSSLPIISQQQLQNGSSMDIDEDSNASATTKNNTANSADIDSELRDFLGTGSSSVEHDSIEQMLMD